MKPVNKVKHRGLRLKTVLIIAAAAAVLTGTAGFFILRDLSRPEPVTVHTASEYVTELCVCAIGDVASVTITPPSGEPYTLLVLDGDLVLEEDPSFPLRPSMTSLVKTNICLVRSENTVLDTADLRVDLKDFGLEPPACACSFRMTDGTVNTLRIVSIRPEGETRHEIVGALQRIGTDASAPVDNFSQGGLTALIDLDSGVLGKASSGDYFDRDGKRIFLSKHPDTGAQIEGVAVPNWKEIKDKIVEVTEQLPFFEYIAWDLVVRDHGVSVLETNMKSSLNIFQVHGGARNTLLGQTYRKHGWLVDDKFFQ